MNKQNYVQKYEHYKEDFKKYFDKKAEMYWKIYTLHYVEDVSYGKLAVFYDSAPNTIKNIVSRVEEFLDNPEGKMKEMGYSYNDLEGYIYIPNEFVFGCYSLSTNANNIFTEAIFLYQNNMGNIIPRERILSYSTQYKNRRRRQGIFEELNGLQIKIKSGTYIKIFENIEDVEGAMHFEFTEECQKYIDKHSVI